MLTAAWTTLPAPVRRRIMQRLLDALDLQAHEARTSASHALLYHLQGSFQETNSEDEQLYWMRENARMVFELGGLEALFVACKHACWRHDWLSSLPDYVSEEAGPSRTAVLTPQDKAALLDEANMDVTVHFSQLYSIVELLRGDTLLAEALMELKPPLPVYLLELVANLREKSIKGFPVKKLVLLLWKSLLATLGGQRDLARCKQLVRQREGLPPKSVAAQKCAASPSDVRHFCAELAAKYPTLAPLRAPGLEGEVVGHATQALPLHAGGELDTEPPTSADEERMAAAKAATAPPPVKLGRQKFQTDQNRPYVLPLQPQAATPSVVDEARSLYASHLHIRTSAWQTWCTRMALLSEGPGPSAALTEAMAAMHITPEVLDESEDVRRLAWVDDVYRGMLPSLQSAVIVLLKLVLATTTSGGTSSAHMRAVAEGTPPEQAPPPTLEDLDIVRHREILNKGISSLLLLCLQWFKASHALKFEYLAQLLLDSNVLLLILKLFGLQEVRLTTRWRCEAYPFGLWEYCRVAGHTGSTATPPSILRSTDLRMGDVWDAYPDDPPRLQHTQDGVPQHAFSWRNMATTVNLTRLLYQVCKGKVHRILLLVQYKSSAILKRTLHVPHDGLELYILKILRSQIPYCGRKWRQSNMNIITQIYLRCRPHLRDEWTGGGDMDTEVEASLGEEQTIRALIQYYNRTQFQFLAPVAGSSVDNAPHAAAKPSIEAERDAFERDAFPAQRKCAASSTPGRYINNMGVEGTLDMYEDMLQELFASVPLESLEPSTPDAVPAPSGGTDTADDGRNVWEHLSPREMDALSRSPGILPVPSSKSSTPGRHMHIRQPSWNTPGLPEDKRRVQSSPSAARPPLHWNMEDLVEDALSTEQDESAPDDQTDTARHLIPDVLIPEAPLSSPQPGGIDEIEHIFGA